LYFERRSGNFVGFPATLFQQLFRPEDASLAARIAISTRANLARGKTRFVATFKPSIASLQNLTGFAGLAAPDCRGARYGAPARIFLL
jgi:hypothetical protein